MSSEKFHRPGEKVILLHGIGRAVFFNHRRLQRRLLQEGYQAHFLRYPSTRHSIEDLAAHYLAPLARQMSLREPADAPLHFVTFSMGGLLLRSFLSRNEVPNLGRVVMIAPPNQGSHWVDHLERVPAFRWFYGPSGVQMRTDPTALPCALPGADYECGVIAGKLPGCSVLAPVFRGQLSDGTVSIHSTHLEGMKEHQVVHGLHALLFQSPKVVELTMRFLRSGTFATNAETAKTLPRPVPQSQMP
ncbi:MAG: esterase/lipase family protein [Opitutales bacterium]